MTDEIVRGVAASRILADERFDDDAYECGACGRWYHAERPYWERSPDHAARAHEASHEAESPIERLDP